MSVFQVQPNGHAPSGLSPGDYVNTAGGLYMVASPGSFGASYNPSSGYWSIKADPGNTAYQMQSMINSAQAQSAANTAQSQQFAREQMDFQERSISQQMAYNSASAREAMQFSREEAQKNREWQERLSSSAHQREVADLVAAGLNPILSAGGAGASTPSGSVASGIAASGATASGSQGLVDNSVTSSVGNLLATLLSTEASRDISRMQTSATMYAADRGLMGSQSVAGSTISAASIAAANAQSLQHQQQLFDEYMAANYPGTMAQLYSAILDYLDGLVNQAPGGNSSSKNIFNRSENGLKSSKLLNNLFNFGIQPKYDWTPPSK